MMDKELIQALRGTETRSKRALLDEAADQIEMDHEAAEQLRGLCQSCDLDRLEELARADKEGRVVVLPCKVGDTVYWAHNKTITRCRVYRVQKNHKGIFICLRGDGKSYGAFQADLAIGKTVFLTCEEAEKALRRAEDG